MRQSHTHIFQIYLLFLLYFRILGSRVDFLCVPCRPAEECGWLRGRHLEDSGREAGRGGRCDPCLALGSDQPQPEPVCTAADRGNGTDPGSDYGGSNEDPGNGWFMCETDMEEAYFGGSSNMSGMSDHL